MSRHAKEPQITTNNAPALQYVTQPETRHWPRCKTLDASGGTLQHILLSAVNKALQHILTDKRVTTSYNLLHLSKALQRIVADTSVASNKPLEEEMTCIFEADSSSSQIVWLYAASRLNMVYIFVSTYIVYLFDNIELLLLVRS